MLVSALWRWWIASEATWCYAVGVQELLKEWLPLVVLAMGVVASWWKLLAWAGDKQAKRLDEIRRDFRELRTEQVAQGKDLAGLRFAWDHWVKVVESKRA